MIPVCNTIKMHKNHHKEKKYSQDANNFKKQKIFKKKNIINAKIFIKVEPFHIIMAVSSRPPLNSDVETLFGLLK